MSLPLDSFETIVNGVWMVGWGLFFLLSAVVAIALGHGTLLFFDRHGWTHRIAGGALLAWLWYGCFQLVQNGNLTEQSGSNNQNDHKDISEETSSQLDGPWQYSYYLCYDVILGVLGLVATLTAARDFPHKYVKNAPGQSGTLDRQAIVTQAEMVEHAFYQGLNLCQALYLHYMSSSLGSNSRNHVWRNGIALFVVTAPWLVRKQFPVHSFSNNWKTQKSINLETLLYRIKKWQYVFYKHVIFHGLNLSMAVQPCVLVHQPAWRLFWISMNAAYVLEFFLQSLVKRGILSQSQMLVLNQWLMLVSSGAAIQSVLTVVQWPLCLLSVSCNFLHRHYDVTNTMFLYVVYQSLVYYFGNWKSEKWFNDHQLKE